MKAQAFQAVIQKAGLNPYVDVPKSVSDYFGGHGYVAVKGFLNDFPILSTLVPSKSGRHHLYINGEMRRKASVDVGDKIKLTIELDTKPRVFSMPKKLKEAIEINDNARLAWENLSPFKTKGDFTLFELVKDRCRR